MFVCPALDFRGAYKFCARHSAAPGPSVKTGSHPSALGPMAAFGMNCRLRMAEGIAQYRTATPPRPVQYTPRGGRRHVPYTGICSQNGCLTNSELILWGDFNVQTRSQARRPNHRKTNSHAEASEE